MMLSMGLVMKSESLKLYIWKAIHSFCEVLPISSFRKKDTNSARSILPFWLVSMMWTSR